MPAGVGTLVVMLAMIVSLSVAWAAPTPPPQDAAAGAAAGAKAEPGAEAPPDPRRVPERRLDEGVDRRRYFDTRWILPAPPVEHDLARRMAALAALRFESATGAEDGAGEGGEQGDGERAARPAWTRSFGDLVRAFGAERRDAKAVEARLARLRSEHPAIWAQVREVLPDLVRTRRLSTREWDADESADDDGFHRGVTWSLKGRSERTWAELDGDRDVHQMATLAWTDPLTLKHAENDFTTYMQRAGTSYLEIGVAPRSVVRGEDALGPFASLTIRSRSDLPFPFGTYTSEVDVLCVPGPGGSVLTHVVSLSDDFHWLAGRDHWIPVRDADGALVATLIVRELGFDLDGVPDGAGARDAAIRSAVGHLKLEAEARGFDPDAEFLPVPRYTVRSP